MKRCLKTALLGGAASSLMLWPAAAQACASCGCTLTADWLSQGLAAQPGTTFSLRYDYIPQTTLRTGTDKIDRARITLPTDREIERYTYNHVVTATLDHQFASDWGLDVQLPYYVRPHSTFADGTIRPSHSNTEGFGDLTVMARWQGLSRPGSVTGLEAGLVLPTGAFRKTFDAGPEAGEDVDRGLQPGTGTVQAVVGAYDLGALAPELGYFVQVTGQTAVNARAGYRPGSVAQVAGTINYTHWRGFTPQLQVSFRATGRDRGPASDRPNSGGEQVNLAPGFSAKLGSRATAFGFVELPLYTRVNGYQLVPKVKASLGVLVHL
jgi:hypothetical protein